MEAKAIRPSGTSHGNNFFVKRLGNSSLLRCFVFLELESVTRSESCILKSLGYTCSGAHYWAPFSHRGNVQFLTLVKTALFRFIG